MRTLRLDLDYDGTDFHGFVPQAGQRTVGGEIERVLTRVLGEPVTVSPGGRTDAGVHARGQVASVKTRSPLGAGEVKRALNALLGHDVLVRHVVDACDGFDARRDATSRRYEYAIWNAPDRTVWHRRWTEHVEEPLDVEAMDEACRVLVGEHDFAAFRTHRTQDPPGRSTVRSIQFIRWQRDAAEPQILKLEIEADGFLRHMVRTIVGSTILVGLGKAPARWIGEVLAGGQRAAAGPTAPARGLALVEVRYEGASAL